MSTPHAAFGECVERGAPVLERERTLAHDLGAELTEEISPQLLADVIRVPRGAWHPSELPLREEEDLGLIVIDGLIEREARITGRSAAELLGPGDLLRPWHFVDRGDACVTVDATWTALETAHVALLDARAGAVATRHPRLTAIFMSRILSRARSLAVLLAIAQIRRLDVRILTLLWHLADRFGRVRPDGVALEIPLKHATIAKLLAATRPAVSTILAELAASGQIARLPGGGWLLLGAAPSGEPR
jgi:CRP/FNR family cyclic AMP-dependent transcriptional regulator